jgi:hypothetical protein
MQPEGPCRIVSGMTTISDPETIDAHVQWMVERMLPDGPEVDPVEVEDHVDLARMGISAQSLGDHSRAMRARGAGVVAVERVEHDGQDIVVYATTADRHHVLVRFSASDDGRCTFGPMQRVADTDDVETITVRTPELDAGLRDGLARCFAATYEGGDRNYLDQQLALFDWIAIALRGGDVVGFVPAMVRNLTIDGVGQRRASMPGLSCIDPSARRKGLFASLAGASGRASLEGGPFPDLTGAKFATPASARGLFKAPQAVPRTGMLLDEVHRATGRAVAAALESADFDEETFVCRGPGRPIGNAVLDVDPNVTPEEWARFANVDRSRGDTLLGVNWILDPPPHW